jgi:hypothetical protein
MPTFDNSRSRAQGQPACSRDSRPGGIGGFVRRFKAVGFAGPDPVPLSGQEEEQMLGSEVVSGIANNVGVSQRFARGLRNTKYYRPALSRSRALLVNMTARSQPGCPHLSLANVTMRERR